MRVGLIGLGSIAEKVYLPLLGGHPRAVLAGVASRSAATVAAAAERYRVPYRTTDFRDLLKQDLDLVFVHAATAAHHEIVRTCLESGVAVYVDKPLSSDLAEAEALAELAERTGLLLAVGFNRRFAPAYLSAREWIHDGPSYFSVSKHRASPQEASARETVYDDAIHILDLAVWLAPEPIAAEEFVLRTDEHGRLLTLAGTLRLGDGTVGSVAMHRRGGADSERLELHGTDRSALVTDMEHVQLTENGRESVLRPGSWDTILKRRGFTDLVDHVLATAGDPAACEVGAERVLAAHRLAERLLAGS